jgi:hypothetical protein
MGLRDFVRDVKPEAQSIPILQRSASIKRLEQPANCCWRNRLTRISY